MSDTLSDEPLLPCVEVGPATGARAAVIWLHGLGADGNDFVPIVAELGQPDVRFVFPHAPSIPVTINGGFVMPAWYDILGEDLRTRHDAAGILLNAGRIEALLRREHELGMPYDRVLLAGFSQGGALALHVGLRFEQRLAGLIALSTYRVLPDRWPAELSVANADTPVFQGHGSLDPMVPPTRGEDLSRALEQRAAPLTSRTYRMAHEVCLEEIRDLSRWLRDLLAD